jgi:hypothetical protein
VRGTGYPTPQKATRPKPEAISNSNKKSCSWSEIILRASMLEIIPLPKGPTGSDTDVPPSHRFARIGHWQSLRAVRSLIAASWATHRKGEHVIISMFKLMWSGTPRKALVNSASPLNSSSSTRSSMVNGSMWFNYLYRSVALVLIQPANYHHPCR